MVRLSSALLVLAASASLAQPISVNGNIVLVQDPTGSITNLVGMQNMSILPSHQEQFCRAAFNAARSAGLSDDFDGVISFSASESLTDLDNVWQGSPIRTEGTGYARVDAQWKGTYNSTKLGQCVFMGTLGRTTSLFGGGFGPEALPADPNGDWAPSIGIQIPGVKSLTGIEMMGHEYGHHWLLGIEFDQNDGRGHQHFIRGFNTSSGSEGGGDMGYPNQHYSHLADSRSVMYGECITDLGGGSFKFEGCPRKYSQIDQYLMGLRTPSEVTPMMVLEDPTAPGQGVDSIAMGRTSGSTTMGNLTRHDITADEIAAAMGPRNPGPPASKNCWRVAFIVVLEPGQTSISQAMLDKVKRYEAAWGPWFSFATDGRGTMDSRIVGGGCLVPMDGGVVMPPQDAGTDVDAGQPEMDAGVDEDAGVDAGTPGEELDAGSDLLPDGGKNPSKDDTRVDIGTIRPGCGCSVDAGGLMGFAALAAVAFGRRRRRA
ncbi:MAG: MYXO-CTERM sorting domain-containing protein [Myxococcaceae bacterium]